MRLKGFSPPIARLGFLQATVKDFRFFRHLGNNANAKQAMLMLSNANAKQC